MSLSITKKGGWQKREIRSKTAIFVGQALEEATSHLWRKR